METQDCKQTEQILEGSDSNDSETGAKSQRHPILARLEENDYDFNGQSLDYEPNLEFDDTDLREDLEVELEEMGAKLLLMQLNNNLHSTNLNRDKLVYSSTSATSSASSEHQNQQHHNHRQPQPSCSGSELGGTNSVATTGSCGLLQQSSSQTPVDEATCDDQDAQAQDVDLQNLHRFAADELLEHSQICDQMYRYDAFLESPQDLLEENFEEAFKSNLFVEQQQQQFSAKKLHEMQLASQNSNKRRSKKSKKLQVGKFNQLFTSNGSANSHERQMNKGSQFGSKLGARTARTGQRLNALIKSATGAIYNGLHLSSSNNQPALNSSKIVAQVDSLNLQKFDPDQDYDQDATDSESDLDSVLFDSDEFLNDDYSDISRYNCVEVAGDDKLGRRIVTIYACRLPADSNRLSHIRLLKYIMFTLNQFVDNDYVVVYFHFGLNSRNKPKLSFLYQAYRAFDRRYKKNLKALYLVQPTNFIRIVWQVFKPIISIKFGRKMRYVNYLHELEQFMHLEQLLIPKQVIELDKRLLESVKTKPSWLYSKPVVQPPSTWHRRLDSQQFRVSLKFIKEHNGDSIAPVVRHCIEYLSNEQALQTEGLFRRSANSKTVKEVQELLNSGEPINFDDFGGPSSGVHVAAVILKTFLRELEEPLLTFELFPHVISFKNHQHHHHELIGSSTSNLGLTNSNQNKQNKFALSNHQDQLQDHANSALKLSQDPLIDANRIRLELAKVIILQQLPDDNYFLLKYILKFLNLIIDRKDLNKMTSSNLAIVFGPNLLWSRDQSATLASISAIIYFTEFLLDNYKQIFVK